MKRIIFLLITILYTGISIAENVIWHDGSADTIAKGRIEVGIFQPLRYGLTDDLELSTFALADLWIPNLTAKKYWKQYKEISFATKHSFNIPTLLLNAISKEGAGGILPENSKIPFIIVFSNEVIATYDITANLKIIGKAGFTFAMTSGKKDFPTIDLPLVYNRTAVYHDNTLFNIGFDLRGKLYKEIDFLIDYDQYLLPEDYAEFCLEHKALLIWKINRKFALTAGYKIVYSDYPSQKQRNTDCFPLLDFQVGFK